MRYSLPRLNDLEAKKADLEIAITKENIVFWISRFKDGDIDIRLIAGATWIYLSTRFSYVRRPVNQSSYCNGLI